MTQTRTVLLFDEDPNTLERQINNMAREGYQLCGSLVSHLHDDGWRTRQYLVQMMIRTQKATNVDNLADSPRSMNEAWIETIKE